MGNRASRALKAAALTALETLRGPPTEVRLYSSACKQCWEDEHKQQPMLPLRRSRRSMRSIKNNILGLNPDPHSGFLSHPPLYIILLGCTGPHPRSTYPRSTGNQLRGGASGCMLWLFSAPSCKYWFLQSCYSIIINKAGVLYLQVQPSRTSKRLQIGAAFEI